VKQVVKPVIEILAALPSVAYGFFALVILAPILQKQGPQLFGIVAWIALLPAAFLAAYFIRGSLESKIKKLSSSKYFSTGIFILILIPLVLIIGRVASFFRGLTVVSGTNALNVSLILGIMALPTIVSVSEDALNAVGRELRENSYALGATRAETVFKVVIPAASSGIVAGIILGVMRAVGETMVVWMASGNSSQVPEPFYNFLSPIRTLTATIAGDMGEAAHVQGAPRYHVLFAMALALLLISFISNLISEWAVKRSRKKLRGER
jgi:phosphate transport system permease protein